MLSKRMNISYKMRLRECGLTTLETMRLRGNKIEVFIILNGYFYRLRKREELEDMELH